MTPGEVVDVFYANAWHRCRVVERGPVPGWAQGWPGVSTDDMLKLRLLPGSANGGLAIDEASWQLLIAASSDLVRYPTPRPMAL
jgi:hypothetical protein